MSERPTKENPGSNGYEFLPREWRSLPPRKKAAAAAFALFLLLVLFPPFSRNLFDKGMGKFQGYRFILNDSDYVTINWKILLLE